MACNDKKVFVNLDMGGVSKVTNLPTPTDQSEAATKAYVDAVANSNHSWKDGVAAATTSNINIASPPTSVDGYTLQDGDRVLVKDQTDATQNGIYVYSAGTLTRATDADASGDLDAAMVTVEHGTLNGNTTFRQSTPDADIGTDDIVWQQFGASSPGATETVAGIAEIATDAEVQAGTDDSRIVTPKKLNTLLGGSSVLHKHAQLIGDGTNLTYTVTHNLGTTDVQVQVFENVSPRQMVLTGVEIVDENNVTVCFTSAPTNNEFSVVVIG
jgi:phage-related tail fiber protein